MNYINILGMIAAVLTTSSLIPQIIQITKTKSTKDISLGMFIIFSLGVFFWLIYGILIHALPVIIANSVTLAFDLIILGYKFKYK